MVFKKNNVRPYTFKQRYLCNDSVNKKKTDNIKAMKTNNWLYKNIKITIRLQLKFQ